MDKVSERKMNVRLRQQVELFPQQLAALQALNQNPFSTFVEDDSNVENPFVASLFGNGKQWIRRFRDNDNLG